MSVDRRSIANTPSQITATVATLLQANSARSGFNIQNQGTNPLFVCFGATSASLVTYHIILKGGTLVSDGNGASYGQSGGSCFTGIITASGTAPTITVLEY